MIFVNFNVVSSQPASLVQGELEDRHTKIIYTDEDIKSPPITKDADVTNHRVVHMEEVFSKAAHLR